MKEIEHRYALGDTFECLDCKIELPNEVCLLAATMGSSSVFEIDSLFIPEATDSVSCTSKAAETFRETAAKYRDAALAELPEDEKAKQEAPQISSEFEQNVRRQGLDNWWQMRHLTRPTNMGIDE